MENIFTAHFQFHFHDRTDMLSSVIAILQTPFMLLGMALLFIAVPRIDPLKQNIEQFRGYFDVFIILVLVFMIAVYLQTILWNKGIQISLNVTLPIGLGLLFYNTSILVENAKMNWFIGIRTPWTLSSEVVWDKTHKVGGKLFKIAGLIGLADVFFQPYTVYDILIPVLFVASFPSYILISPTNSYEQVRF
ncbi:MAG: SdpI family protein [Anaerolineales bacterium]|nr:SdpI family protein [Anaerolineales bacterium]